MHPIVYSLKYAGISQAQNPLKLENFDPANLPELTLVLYREFILSSVRNFVFFRGILRKIRNGRNRIPMISTTFSSAGIEIFLLMEFRRNMDTEIMLQH